MQSDKFIGREDEVAQLESFLKKKTASLIVVKGRRRVGKSRLIEKFSENQHYYKFTGLAPDGNITAQDQRDEFTRKLSEQTDLPEIKVDDWGKLLTLFAREVTSGRVIIFFDEISWMAADDKTFLGKLKNVWEDHFKKNNKLILILCSSVSTWIEKNIISSTGYFGRISWTLSLDPLPLHDCNKMLESQGFKASAQEKFKILSVTGGIPWYIEQMQGQYNADENIKRQCFTQGGVLVEDFNKIFHELFEKRDGIYKKIIEVLADGVLSYDDIAMQANYPKSGRLTEYLNNLTQAGFITQDYTWSLTSGKSMTISRYRISDNYIRFYLRYIAPRQTQIANKRIKTINLSSLPGWASIILKSAVKI